jgi:hypothetical protein
MFYHKLLCNARMSVRSLMLSARWVTMALFRVRTGQNIPEGSHQQGWAQNLEVK